VKYLDRKGELIELGRKIKWHPAFMRSRYENWVKGLSWDWAIFYRDFLAFLFRFGIARNACLPARQAARSNSLTKKIYQLTHYLTNRKGSVKIAKAQNLFPNAT